MLPRFFLNRVFRYIGSRVADSIHVVFADGSQYRNHDVEPILTIRFKNRRAEWRSFLFFYQGLIEGYIDGDIDIEADRPMETLADIGRRATGGSENEGASSILDWNPIMWLRFRLQEWRQDNYDHAQAQKNAVFHYGLDPRFFEMLLGRTVGYSEGFWTPNTKTLDQAKVNNYEYICRKLRLQPGDHVVEVGAGWGYLPIYMVKKYDVTVTVYNPVPRQNEYMRARFKAHSVENQITLIEGDHRDIAQRVGEFDKYLSIGVYEHTGYRPRQYDAWLDSISRALKDGGIGFISTTTFANRYMTEFLILKYIFPGGHIPSLSLTLSKMRAYNLNLIEVENLWPHYQKTMMCWRDNLYANWDKIHTLDPKVFTESFRRAWLMYLEGTIDVFEKRMDLSHILFTKGRSKDAYPWVHHAPHTESRFIEGDTVPECYELKSSV